MGGPKSMDPRDLATGAVLQCAEAASLGMPFEVWKTRMGRFRNESTIEAFWKVKERAGWAGFWQGTGAKMVESASKGAVLLFAKESIFNACHQSGQSEIISGVLAGAGGGVCQTVVMGPCTFVVTTKVTTKGEFHLTPFLRKTWADHGIRGFYPGGSAIAFRQASNWASRQGITEIVRTQVKGIKAGGAPAESVKLSAGEEAGCGLIGGALSTWNQPFEVARIEMQAAASDGEAKKSMIQTMRAVVAEAGPQGLFKGIIPRVGLGMWQTLFMVSGAKVLKQYM